MAKTLSNLQFNGFHKRKRCLSFSFQFHFSKNEPQSFFFFNFIIHLLILLEQD